MHSMSAVQGKNVHSVSAAISRISEILRQMPLRPRFGKADWGRSAIPALNWHFSATSGPKWQRRPAPVDHFCPQLAFTRENRKTVFAKTATEGFSACCSGAFLAEGDGSQGEEKGEKSPERGQIEPYGGKIGAAQHDGSQGVHAIGHGHEAA